MEDNSYHFIKAQSLKQQYNQHFEAKPRNKSMYCSNFMLKIIIITLFLCVIPLFPSEPPEFISKTVFAKSWELIHLLVIGVALSYGLFCRRKSSEQNGPKSCVLEEGNGNVGSYSGSFGYEGEGLRNFGENGVGSGRFEFSGFRSEPYVVVKRGCGGDVVERSLGLPVRSLRSRVVETDSESEGDFGGESLCSDSNGFCEGEKDESLEGCVGGKGVLNGWNSRSTREGFGGVYGEKGVNFEGGVGRDGFESGWESRSMRTGFVGGDGDFGLHCGEGGNFKGNVGSNGFENGWQSGSMKTGFMDRDGDFELHCGIGENFEGNVGSDEFENGWNSGSMRTDFRAGNGDFGLHGRKDENFEVNVGNYVAPNEWKSQSMRTNFVAGNGDFGLHGGKGENLEGNVGGGVAPNEWKSQSMRTNFVAGNGDFGLHGGKGENLEGNVGGGIAPNEWKSQSMRTTFMTGNGDFGLHGGKYQNLEGNVGGGVAPNEWKFQSMKTGFMAGNGDFGLHGGKGGNFEVNVDNNAFPNRWNSRSMRTESGNVELANGKGENLERNVGNSSPVSRKSQSMRSDFVVNNGTFESELSKSRSFRYPVQGGASYEMNAGFCSWLPQSPIMPEENSWGGVSFNTPLSNHHTQVNNSNYVNSSSTFDNCTRMYNYENGNWGTPPILENANSFSQNSTVSMPSEKDVAQPILSTPQKKNEENFVPRTPEVPPSVPVPSRDFASPARASKRSKSKLRFSNKKNEKLLEKDSVENFAQGDNSGAFHVISPVTVPTPVYDVAKPIKASFLKKNEDVDSDTTLILKNAPNSDSTSRLLQLRSTDVNHGPPIKKDGWKCSESVNEMPKDDVQAPSTKSSIRSKNNKKSFPVRWDEDCFVIPLSENNDTRDLEQVVQDDHDPEPTDLTEVALSTDPPSGRMSFDEQGLRQKRPADYSETEYLVEEDVKLKRTTDFSEMQNLSKENEADKPSTPLPPPPGLPPLVEIRENGIDIDVRASAESSSGVLSDGLFLDGQHGMDHGSPPTPKKDKSLSKASHYKPSSSPPPGPPPRVEIRADEIDINIPSSLESSSRALLEEQHDMDQGLPVTPKIEKLSKTTHPRGFSCTSFFDRDLRKSFKNEAREENRKSEGDQYVGKAGKCGCLSLDVRPTLSKAALKGKSVRTIRPREVVPERNNQNDHFEQKLENTAERKGQNSELVVIKIGISEKRPSTNSRKGEKQRNAVGTSIIVGVNSKEGSSAKSAVLCEVKDEPDSEIDKKADEFIAKFKEQIRLQKVSARAESGRRQLPQKHP